MSEDIYRADVVGQLYLDLVEVLENGGKVCDVVANHYRDKKGIYSLIPYSMFDDECLIIRKHGKFHKFIKILNLPITRDEILRYNAEELGN
jgi:hypothetical protein